MIRKQDLFFFAPVIYYLSHLRTTADFLEHTKKCFFGKEQINRFEFLICYYSHLKDREKKFQEI